MQTIEPKTLKFSLEVELTRWPDEVIESRMRDIEAADAAEQARYKEMGRPLEDGHLFPYQVKTRVKMGDKQIGLVKSVLFAARADCTMPSISLDIASPPGLSDHAKQQLAQDAEMLAQIPFIRCQVQGAPPVQKYLPGVMGASSAGELLVQLASDLEGPADWHDRVVEAFENLLRPEARPEPVETKP